MVIAAAKMMMVPTEIAHEKITDLLRMPKPRILILLEIKSPFWFAVFSIVIVCRAQTSILLFASYLQLIAFMGKDFRE